MTLSRSREGTLELPGYLAGQPLRTDGTLEVFNPYSGELVGTVATAGRGTSRPGLRGSAGLDRISDPLPAP